MGVRGTPLSFDTDVFVFELAWCLGEHIVLTCEGQQGWEAFTPGVTGAGSGMGVVRDERGLGSFRSNLMAWDNGVPEGGARPRISDPTSQISLKLLRNVAKGPLDAPRAPDVFFEDPKGGVGVVPPWPEKPDLKKFIEFFQSSVLATIGTKLA